MGASAPSLSSMNATDNAIYKLTPSAPSSIDFFSFCRRRRSSKKRKKKKKLTFSFQKYNTSTGEERLLGPSRRPRRARLRPAPGPGGPAERGDEGGQEGAAGREGREGREGGRRRGEEKEEKGGGGFGRRVKVVSASFVLFSSSSIFLLDQTQEMSQIESDKGGVVA